MADPYGLGEGISSAEGELQASPSAYDPSAAPSGSDISAQIRLMGTQAALKKQESANLKERWYGTQNLNAAEGQPAESEPGLLERGLGALTAPLKAEVGVAKYVSGKAEPGQGFLETVNQNMGKAGETWGQYLESVGVPHAVSMPVGLALDIGLDPLNVATGGVDTLLGRTMIGGMKGGLEGVALGAGSRGLEIVSKVASKIPGLKVSEELAPKVQATIRVLRGEVPGLAAEAAPEALSAARAGMTAAAKREGLLNFGMRAKAAVTQMGEKALALRKEFNAKTGYDVMSELDRVAEHGAWGFKPGKALEDLIVKALPDGRGESIVKALKFSSIASDERKKAISALQVQLLDPMGWKPKAGGFLATGKTAEQSAADLAAISETNGVFRTTGKPEEIALLQKKLELLKTIDPEPAEAALGDTAGSLSREFQNVPWEGRPVSAALSHVAESGGALLRGGTVRMPRDNEELMMFFEKAGLEGEEAQAARAMLGQIERGRKGETGIEFYDKAMRNLHDTVAKAIHPKAAAVMDKAIAWMDIANKYFTIAKTSLNPGTYTANFISGHIMTGMEGVDITSKGYLVSQKAAWDIMTGKVPQASLLKKLVAKLGGDIRTGPVADLLRDSLDVDFSTFSDGKLIQDVLKDAAAGGEKVSSDEILKFLNQSAEEMKAAAFEVRAAGEAKTASEIEKASLKQVRKKYFKAQPSAIEKEGALVKDAEGNVIGGGFGSVDAENLPNSFFLSQIAHQGNFAEFLNSLNAKAEMGSVAAKMLYTTLTKPATWYGNIDKAQRLGTFIHLVVNGLPEAGLKTANKMVNFGANGVAETEKVAGELRYLLTPEAAISVANDAGTNYAAMPAFVQLMRSIPVIGSSFVAFPYAMSVKTAKTLAYNPAFFNKVAFAMQEAGGRKTPLEKEAMGQGDPTKPAYYSFLQGPGFERLPFFQDHPVYLNMTNWLPYYSLNMLMPSERNYNDTWAGKVSDLVDHSPLFKNPVGQMLIDYVLLPHLLSEGETPQGYFGQQVYPADATAVEKAKYAARSLVEAYTPGVAGLAGLATPMLPEAMRKTSFIENVPSYRYRALAQATQGKGPLGIESKAVTLPRSILAALGVSTTPIDLTNQAQNNP